MEDHAGPWRLGRVVSAGALAEVREASADDGSPVVAVKRLHHHAAREPELRALFEAECRLTCTLPPSDHVVRGLFSDPGAARPFLVMPLHPGPDLRARLDGGPITRAEAVAIVAGAAAGLAHLHAAGWVHGDVNPANLLSGPGGAALCDLGVARPVGAAGPVRGTAAYMAPEQVRGEPWTAAVDVFALGVILWELVRGERLFHRGQSFLSMAAVVELTPPVLDDALGPLTAAALAKDPAARPSAAELAAAVVGG